MRKEDLKRIPPLRPFRHSAWFTKAWWGFLFEKPRSIRAFFCRMMAHPYDVVWFNPGGLEPDMTCRNCGDDLG